MVNLSKTSDCADMWDDLVIEDNLKEKIWSKERSFASDVARKFFARKSSVAGLIFIVLLIIFAFVMPFFSKYSYETQTLAFSNIPPKLDVYEIDGEYYFLSRNLKVIHVSPSGQLLESLSMIEENGMKKQMTFESSEGKQVRLSYKKKPAGLIDEDKNKLKPVKTLWNKTFILGTDALGRDMLTRLMFGTIISLTVAFVATVVNMTIGILYGGFSGYIGGNVDAIMMRFVDIINTIPLTLYVILIMVILDSGFLSIIIALSSVYWVNMARQVRGQIYSLKENEYVYAAKTIGSSSWTILTKHLLPNAMGPILVTATMLVPSAIFIEAFMSFIGLGIAPPMASLGTMCNDAIQTLRTAPYQLFEPSVVICIIMFAFSFVGDGLRSALDPKLRG